MLRKFLISSLSLILFSSCQEDKLIIFCNYYFESQAKEFVKKKLQLNSNQIRWKIAPEDFLLQSVKLGVPFDLLITPQNSKLDQFGLMDHFKLSYEIDSFYHVVASLDSSPPHFSISDSVVLCLPYGVNATEFRTEFKQFHDTLTSKYNVAYIYAYHPGLSFLYLKGGLADFSLIYSCHLKEYTFKEILSNNKKYKEKLSVFINKESHYNIH